MVSSRRALCVGINNFQNYPSAALQGCVNDANDMASVLKEFLGFSGSDIILLTDAQATKSNIMKNLESMVKDAKAGKYNYLVFSLSSHGTQVPDVSGDEPDNADEAFCPYDLAQAGDQWDPKHVITDDELHDLFIQLPPKVLLEVFLDTCHSGTGIRAIDLLLDRKPRYLPPPSLKAFEKLEGRQSRGLRAALLDKGMIDHILWAGCRADQTSADAKIGKSWHGAFTYYLCKEMQACRNELSRKELMKKVRAAIRKGKYTQTPQLECQATRRQARFT